MRETSFTVSAVARACLLFLLNGSAPLVLASTGFQSNPALVQHSNSASGASDLPALDNITAPALESNKNITLATSDVNGINELPEWRRKLPTVLQNKAKTLQRIVVPGRNGCCVEVYLLGTAHVSMDSSRDVRLLLEAVQPNVLFLELCDQRIPMMLSQPPSPPPPPTKDDNADKTTKQGLWKRLRSTEPKPPPPEGSRSMYGMAAGLLTNMQQDYATSLGVELGGEFRVAYNYWEEHRRHEPLHMILGDRPLYLTLTRAWESLRIWGKTKLVVGLLVSSFQKPNPEELREWMQKILSDDSGDLLTESIAELAQHFPTLEQVIIKERDAYMACKLYQTCQQLLSPRHSNTPKVRTLIAIVGAGHVEGMCRWLTEGNGQSPEEILEPLVRIRKAISDEERRILVHDVMEVNHELLQSMAQEMQSPTTEVRPL